MAQDSSSTGGSPATGLVGQGTALPGAPQGKAVQLKKLEPAARAGATGGAEGVFAELVFDLQGESANRFNSLTLGELARAVAWLKGLSGLRGVLVTSAKEGGFILGADVTEFTEHFAKPAAELEQWMLGTHQVFSAFEDLPCPTVCAIGGFALGGGLEFALTASFRVLAANAKIGLPETKLGIFPGWGGTVRFSRLVGADNAIEWIASGQQYKAPEALKVGAVDAVTPPERLREAALRMLLDAAEGKLAWRPRQERKRGKLQLSAVESAMVFDGAKAFVAGQAGPNYPAPVAAIEAMQAGARLTRDEALLEEVRAFVKVAKTPQASALVGVFLADQLVKRKARGFSKAARPVREAAVIGAGIMGGGIAYQSASSGIPAVMKDIRPEALELGMREAAKLLEKRVEKGQLKASEMAGVLARIRQALGYGEVAGVDIVVEAVVENEGVKNRVLSELEAAVRPETVLCSNTSTISIDRLAARLARPENFVGMHFFNPVHRMPLVEIIRGRASAEAAVATAVAYATAMGKTAIVVNDCPGFLVNRVLFPYVWAFLMLLRDGVGFERIDRVMEKFGWPMGPAYLMDVVGVDTAFHCLGVMAEGFPDRMRYDFRHAIQALYENQRFGQKNSKGFFRYSQDPKGKPRKEADPEIAGLLATVTGAVGTEVSDEDIVYRMLLPMIFECSRCLEESIVGSAEETDLALLYGLGFPPFRGGALRYADTLGAARLVELGDKFAALGKLYEPTAQVRENARSGAGFYSVSGGLRK